MRSKVKSEQLKLGDTLYFISQSVLSKGVQKATVTTLSLDEYGDKLLELMDKYNAKSLREITEEQAKEYYEELKNKKEKGI